MRKSLPLIRVAFADVVFLVACFAVAPGHRHRSPETAGRASFTGSQIFAASRIGQQGAVRPTTWSGRHVRGRPPAPRARSARRGRNSRRRSGVRERQRFGLVFPGENHAERSPQWRWRSRDLQVSPLFLVVALGTSTPRGNPFGNIGHCLRQDCHQREPLKGDDRGIGDARDLHQTHRVVRTSGAAGGSVGAWPRCRARLYTL